MWRSIRSMCAGCWPRLPADMRSSNRKRMESARWQSSLSTRISTEVAKLFSLRIPLGCLSRKGPVEAAGLAEAAELEAARVGQVAAEQAAKGALEARAVLVGRVALAEQAAKAVPVAREQQEEPAEARPGVPAAGRPRISTIRIRFIRNRGPSFRNSRHRRQQISRFSRRLLTEPAGS